MSKTKVAELRKEYGWTQEELAEHAYVTVRTVQRIEAGEAVNDVTLKSISNALAVTVNELFESIDTDQQENHIVELAQQQVLQVNRRSTETKFYKILIFAMSFLFMTLGLMFIYTLHIDDFSALIMALSLLFSIFLIILSADYYFIKILLMRRLDIKYPLSIGTTYKKDNQSKNAVTTNWMQFFASYWWLIFPIGALLCSIIESIEGN